MSRRIGGCAVGKGANFMPQAVQEVDAHRTRGETISLNRFNKYTRRLPQQIAGLLTL